LDARYRYDGDQKALAIFAASLDDQSDRLRKDVADMQPAHLEWQHRLGFNTIGMLIAHIALAEAYWVRVAKGDTSDYAVIDDEVLRMVGIRLDDDGMPAAADAMPPATLHGKTVADLLGILDRARAETHRVFLGWTDADLDRTFATRKGDVTIGWMCYHLVEHMAAHYGQIGLLRHMLSESAKR